MALVFLVLTVLAGAAYSAPNRIVGGWPTTIEKYPSIVQVEALRSGLLWSHSCAANILNTRYVLSAAHCFHGRSYRPEERRIRAGTTLRGNGGLIVYIEREFNHPTYGRNGYDGDVSVVRLTSFLSYTPEIQRGLFIQPGVTFPDNLPVQHAGWGTIRQGGPLSDILLETTIYTINHQLCRERYAAVRQVVTENMICAGLLDVGGRDACQGDSGGPLYYNDGQTGDVVIGVVSWGQGCAQARFPGVSANVSSYIDWIQTIAV